MVHALQPKKRHRIARWAPRHLRLVWRATNSSPSSWHDGRRGGRPVQWIQASSELESPHQVSPRLTKAVPAAAGGNRDVLLPVEFVDRGGRVRTESGLESPELVSCSRIERPEVPVGPAMKEQPSRGGEHSASEASQVGNLLLPHLLVGP